MPTLEPGEIDLLHRIIKSHGTLTSENFGGDLACWNWALSGLSEKMVWPEYIYGYVTGSYNEQELRNLDKKKEGIGLVKRRIYLS